MAIVFMDGFDSYNATNAAANGGLLAGYASVGSNQQYGVAAGRFGGQALRMTDGQGSNPQLRRAIGSVHGPAFCVGLAVRHDVLAQNTSDQWMTALMRGTQIQLAIGINNSVIYAARGTTILGRSPAGTLPEGVFVYVEMMGVIDPTNGWLKLYVGGTLVVDYVGNTKGNGADNLYDTVDFRCVDASGSGRPTLWDDVYVSNQSARIGERKIELIYPNADTELKQFVPSVAGANFATVDDSSPADYNDGANINDTDLYDLGNLASSPIIGGNNFDAIRVIAQALKTDSSARELQLLVRQGGVLNANPSSQALTTTNVSYGQIIETDPATGAKFTLAGINSLQAGMKVSV